MSTQSTKIRRICEVCGAEFLAERRQVARGWGSFCSHSCKNASQSSPLEDRFFDGVGKKDPVRGCILWRGPVSKRTRYGILGDAGHQYSAHRLSYSYFIGPIHDGLFVCHVCDVRLCINPLHLFLGTNVENQADKVAKERQARGVENGKSNLNEETVSELRYRASIGKTSLQELAKEYDVSASTIHRAMTGRTWRHVR